MIAVASGFVLGEGMTSIVNACLKSAGVTWVWCGGCPAGFCSGCPWIYVQTNKTTNNEFLW